MKTQHAPLVNGRYVNTKTLLRRLGITAPTLKKWVRKGFIPPAIRPPGCRVTWDLFAVQAAFDKLALKHPVSAEGGGAND